MILHLLGFAAIGLAIGVLSIGAVQAAHYLERKVKAWWASRKRGGQWKR